MKKILSLVLACLMLVGSLPFAVLATSADVPSEVESNDTTNTATAIEGGKISGTNSNDDDIDWYKFETTGDYFEVGFRPGTENPGYDFGNGWKIEIYDSKMNELVSYNYVKGAIEEVKIPVSGTIYIKVYASNVYNSGVNGVLYEITVKNTVNSHWESEYNDKAATANVINANEKYIANLYKEDDVDWFKFTSKGCYSLNFGLNMESAEGIPDTGWNITVYDSSLQVIKEYKNVTKTVSSTLPFVGIGYIKICANNPYRSDLSFVSYDLVVNTFASSVWEKEYNDISKTATVIKQGTTYNGNLYKANDVDFYKFKSTTNAFKIRFSINLSEVSVDDIGNGWTVSVYPADSGASIVEEYKVNSVGTFETPVLPYEKGKEYYIKIAAKNSYSGSPVDQTYHIAVVDATSSKKWEVEKGGNDFKYSTTVADSNVYYGNLSYSSDKDYYRYVVSAAGKLKIDFSREDSELDGYGYKVELKTSSGKTVYSKTINDIQRATYTNIAVSKGTYYLVVSAVNAYSGAPASSIIYNIKVALTINTPTLSKVEASGKKTVKATWKKVGDVTGYQIQYATNKNFSGAKTITVTSCNTTSRTISKLAAKKTYYVRIRTYKKDSAKTYYSGWSSVKYAKTK